MNLASLLAEEFRLPAFLTVLWLFAVCAIAWTNKNPPAPLIQSVFTLAPLIWSVESMWFLGLPIIFLFGATGLVLKTRKQSPLAQSMGNGLLIGVASGMFCRGFISIASGK